MKLSVTYSIEMVVEVEDRDIEANPSIFDKYDFEGQSYFWDKLGKAIVKVENNEASFSEFFEDWDIEIEKVQAK